MLQMCSKCILLLLQVSLFIAVLLLFYFYQENRSDSLFVAKISKIVRELKQNDKKIEVSQHPGELYVLPLSKEILEIHRRLNLTNPGYLGEPVKLPNNLPEDIQILVNKSQDYFKFNEFVSQLIPFDRELKDFRGKICRAANYSSDLPKVSVILAFYNEPFSMLMRTIYSVLKRSPPELIEEILLVDDCSDRGSISNQKSNSFNIELQLKLSCRFKKFSRGCQNFE